MTIAFEGTAWLFFIMLSIYILLQIWFHTEDIKFWWKKWISKFLK